ncbi:MAG: divalent cation tolerance protein CutA [Nitrosopumilaceae archaeon]
MYAVVIMSTYPDKRSLLTIVNVVMEKQLAACVNFTKIQSIYTWHGKIANTKEFLAFFKTTNKVKNSLKKEIKKLHPYEVPEIAEIKISSINKPYLDWLLGSTRNKSQKRYHSTKR